MSKAGIQSNRGDGYQTLVAFDWALTVLSDPGYQWLEVDSVNWPVDDVVVGKADGRIICCQCKKNQTQHRSWSLADLEDELRKAISLFKNTPQSEAWFYSRTAFGELAALREFSRNYSDESSFKANLTNAHRKTDSRLSGLLLEENSELSTYQFLKRISFENSPELERMAELLGERLRQLASNGSAAFDAIWYRLDNLGMRVGSSGVSSEVQHRLSREELKDVLNRSGSVLTPPMAQEEIRAAFESTSSVGRAWKTDVGTEHLSNSAVDELVQAIQAKYRSVLLTGMPGSGKTCVMLDVQEHLERMAQDTHELAPLFIQSREFADLVAERDRKAQGLSGDLVSQVARLAETTHVVVMIDSLDVLSIAREHTVLTYFLSLIDRLLIIPKVTVVAACRDFDRHYDLRIAQRTWEVEIACQPLDWERQVEPLLSKLDIDASVIDQVTRDLIRNPRELALFVDLALQMGSFNVVTSQALSEQYLATFVGQGDLLGDVALHAIEEMASEMLKLRTLTLPQQRFGASQEVKRGLLSNHILHETREGQLTFGHQTLLDVLVISRAVRLGMSLNEFIQGLPPVPFVRPSIRSFVMQLASKDRVVFRRQLRAVLSGSAAFHIRRLVAETFAEYVPQDDDWLLILDLRRQHKEVFQVIYNQADGVEWHYFWLKHLVPFLKNVNDVEGLTTHAHRISQWKNEDAVGVIAFWSDMLAIDGIDHERLAESIAQYIARFDAENIVLCGPLLTQLLGLPRQEHSLLGSALARLVEFDSLDDAALWSYIAGEVSEADVVAFHLNNKLRCQTHEFGSKNQDFLSDRMRASTALLDLAVTSVEQWSKARAQRYGTAIESLLTGFLNETSYGDVHSQLDLRHIDNERVLFDALESAIVHHARTQSCWWADNRERLAFSSEGALRYFAILGCTEATKENLDLIAMMLSDREWFESLLSYEIGSLLKTAYPHLDGDSQERIQATLLSLHEVGAADPQERDWRLIEQSQLVLAIPCHLRTQEAQAVIDECETLSWPLERAPRIGARGGMVRAPFSFKKFLDVSDAGALRLLTHYDGYESRFDEFLVGGQREVGRQLREAASRHPSRFVGFLSKNWLSIPDCFRDDIMEGVGEYLRYEYGDLRPNGDWLPIESPDATVIARNILDELEGHPEYWHHNRAASKAIEGCAFVVADGKDSDRLACMALEFSTLKEESSVSGDSVDLITTGINMSRGNIANALMVLANQHEEKGISWPDSLLYALRRFSDDKNPAVRSVLLRRMPYLQSLHAEIGWELFGVIMQKNVSGLWEVAEPCLYHAYHKAFDRVQLWLDKVYDEGKGKDLETWGRISALAAFSGKVDFSSLLIELKAMESVDAWSGAASVWSHSDNLLRHRDQCLSGLDSGLNLENKFAVVVARKFRSLLQKSESLAIVPIDLIKRCFALLEKKSESGRSDIFGIDKWLSSASLIDPAYALEAAELYFEFVRRTKAHLYDHENCLTQLLTRFFAHAEELEESDGGEMLHRVVVVQDLLLALGVNSVDDWLKEAERSLSQ